jgi:histidinol-phosphate aminotransferase
VTAIGKVKRAFDVTSPAQAAALASIDDTAELDRRRRLNSEGRAELERVLRAAGYDPAGPAVANFLYVDVGEDARAVFERFLQRGVIVRPLHGFGAPSAIRVTVGTPDEHAFLARALGQ